MFCCQLLHVERTLKRRHELQLWYRDAYAVKGVVPMSDSGQPDGSEEGEIHRAVSDDGTEIAGRVYGDGPPLVLVHGAMADGEFIWEPLVPFLTDRFTCYTMSVRNRGLSGHGDDLSSERRMQDVRAFVESIDEPTRVLGWSQGGLLALDVAANTDAVSAVAVYEPPAFEVISEDELAHFTDLVERMSELVAADESAVAARTFLEWVANEEELAHPAAEELLEGCAPNVPVFLQEVQELDVDGPSPTSPSRLAEIDVPALLLCGSRSVPDPWLLDSVDHIAEHVSDSRVRTIDGVGHMAPVTDPETVASELEAFFTAMPEPSQ